MVVSWVETSSSVVCCVLSKLGVRGGGDGVVFADVVFPSKVSKSLLVLSYVDEPKLVDALVVDEPSVVDSVPGVGTVEDLVDSDAVKADDSD